MNIIYKAPNLIISPKRKVYRRERGGGGTGALNGESIYTHTYTLSLSISPPPIHTYIYHNVRKRRLMGGEKMHLQSRFEG